jgi:hypothetical protein
VAAPFARGSGNQDLATAFLEANCRLDVSR